MKSKNFLNKKPLNSFLIRSGAHDYYCSRLLLYRCCTLFNGYRITESNSLQQHPRAIDRRESSTHIRFRREEIALPLRLRLEVYYKTCNSRLKVRRLNSSAHIRSSKCVENLFIDQATLSFSQRKVKTIGWSINFPRVRFSVTFRNFVKVLFASESIKSIAIKLVIRIKRERERERERLELKL